MSKENKEQKIVVSGVLEQEGKYLVVRRGPHEQFLPGKYEFPGGKVDFGEEAQAALVREFKEEVGLDVDVIDLIRSFNYVTKGGARHTVEFVYNVELVEKAFDDVRLGQDHDKFAWISMSELQQYGIEGEILETFRALGYTGEKLKKQHKQEDNNTTEGDVHIYTDGGSRGNPGPSASGYVIMSPDEEIIEEGGEYLGITTNNQAEYQAVKLALEAVEKYHPKKIRFFIDSLLVVNQMKGTYKIKNRDLWPIHQNIKELIAGFDEVTFTHVRREYNKMADAKVNEVLDSYEHH
ncbi:MAG: reverse transcriptase-like protein [Candidatus Saccharimonadales bacterium]|nr:reverse transcriptase-like protein [Candidatus Saccharimonadales bacterium]